jgi:Protein of unknown function (DUF3667)
MLTADTWTCPTCAQPCESRFCSECGEHAPQPHDLSLVGFAEHAVEEFAHVDGRVFRTFRALLRSPGGLTLSYVNGQRRPLLGPLQVFLIANLIFFGFQSLFHASVFSNPLSSQVHNQFYKGLAARLVDARTAALDTTQDEFAPAFDHAVAVNAKSLIIVMTPPFALLAALLFYTSHRPFVTHVVFAIHFYAFWMIAFCVVGGIVGLLIAAFVAVSGIRLTPPTMDALVTYALTSCAAAYLAIAAGRVYGARGPGRVVKAIVLGVASSVTIVGYRLVVFLITLYTTA